MCVKLSKNKNTFKILDEQYLELTSNKFLILNDRNIGLQAGETEELSPRDAELVDIRALPVIEPTPRGQYQYPVISIFSQRLNQGGHSNVDIPPQIEALRRVYIIQQVPKEMREVKSSSFKDS